jgi:hypothetical protein
LTGSTVMTSDALKYELPETWLQDFVAVLEGADVKVVPILARTFGYRRVQCGPQLLAAMRRCVPEALPEIIWALGRTGYEHAGAPLFDYMKSKDEHVRAAAAAALLRMGDRCALDYCVDQAQHHVWPILALGLAGGAKTLGLVTKLAAENGAEDSVTALGLIGDPVSVPFLISRLEQPDTAPQTAFALDCLTGAALYETVFVPDKLDEDELFESERRQLKEGKQPNRGGARTFGSNVTQISQNPEDWNRWWRLNHDRFTPGVRYRNGQPFSPARLVEVLAAEGTPHLLRRYCSEELVARYHKDFGLEVDMPVARQMIVLSQAAAWFESGRQNFQEGAWYFAGSPL